MTARERVMAAVTGKPPDRTPAMFTIHFPPECHSGDAAMAAHLQFFRESQSDIGKIMNENLLRSDAAVVAPVDLAQVRINAATRKGVDAQVDLVKRITDTVGGDLITLGTIHGPIVSIHHMSGRSGFFVDNLDFYRTCKRENPAALKEALKYATDALCDLVRRCIDEGGMDGMYFAALGAEKSLFTAEEYAELVRPFDLMVFEAANCKPCFNVLHICKKGVDVARFMDYPAEVFNWEMSSGNPVLEEALALVPEHRAILGGHSNEHGPLITGSMAELEAETHRILTLARHRRWIMGAGCTLPTTTDIRRIRTVIDACVSFPL